MFEDMVVEGSAQPSQRRLVPSKIHSAHVDQDMGISDLFLGRGH
jgi:hypothetical protein